MLLLWVCGLYRPTCLHGDCAAGGTGGTFLSSSFGKSAAGNCFSFRTCPACLCSAGPHGGDAKNGVAFSPVPSVEQVSENLPAVNLGGRQISSSVWIRSFIFVCSELSITFCHFVILIFTSFFTVTRVKMLLGNKRQICLQKCCILEEEKKYNIIRKTFFPFPMILRQIL